ncbi:MAG TPA: radical SAM protein [Candidatus Paceibacterota bacterium]|nr:radical SAM protein [Candidatus Paceibacterota bacterium]
MKNRISIVKSIMLAKKYPRTALQLLKDGFIDKFGLHKETSSAPNLIVLYLSETCNLRCSMCNIWESRNKFGETVNGTAFTIEDIENIVNQVELFKPMFYFIGGEPTLNSDLTKIISYIHKKGMITSLTTNGWLLPHLAKPLFDSGLDFISVSLDGPNAEIHDKSRGVSGVFERVTDGIRKLVEIKKKNRSIFPNIKINTVVTPWNIDKLESIIALAKNLGVDEMSFQNFSFFGEKIQKLNNFYVDIKKTGKIIMGMKIGGKTPFSETEIEKIVKFLKSLPRLSKKYGLSLLNVPYVNNYEEYYKGTLPAFAHSWCYGPWHTATIRGSGDLEVCQGYVVGNIKENKLMDLWNNEKYRYFRKIIKKEHITPACYRCCNLNTCFKK